LRPELGLRCPNELDTYLAVLATPNWLSSHRDLVFAPKIGYCRRAQFEGEHAMLGRSEM
jgi:hypothetical protein